MSERRLLTIDSEYLRPDLAACFLRVERDEAAIIETNTARAAPAILRAIDEAGLQREQVRWVIVTHAHLDHAGGAAALIEALPHATLVAHPRAARHLIDPSRLVASASAVYGAERFEAIYGTIDPIPAERVRTVEEGETVELGGAEFPVLHTRGHAKHHFVLHDPARETVYTGDTFGLVYPRLQRAGRFALASTSPTDFEADEARRSVDRILALGTRTACLTHFGEVDRLEETAQQLRRWIDRSEEILEAAIAEGPEDLEGWIRGRLEVAMSEAVESRGLSLDDGDRELLSLDLELNAQGLAFVAGRRLAS